MGDTPPKRKGSVWVNWTDYSYVDEIIQTSVRRQVVLTIVFGLSNCEHISYKLLTRGARD
jgi:hypothetical protein